MNTTTTDLSPIVKHRHLRCPTDHAFDTYVRRIGEWWPTEYYSIHGSGVTDVQIESRVGGRILETGPAGEQAVWGTLTVWEPTTRLAHTWHPGSDPETATRVELTFEATDTGCALTLEHSGWEAPGRAASRPGYDEGWDQVLDCYLEVAEV